MRLHRIVFPFLRSAAAVGEGHVPARLAISDGSKAMAAPVSP